MDWGQLWAIAAIVGIPMGLVMAAKSRGDFNIARAWFWFSAIAATICATVQLMPLEMTLAWRVFLVACVLIREGYARPWRGRRENWCVKLDPADSAASELDCTITSSIETR